MKLSHRSNVMTLAFAACSFYASPGFAGPDDVPLYLINGKKYEIVNMASGKCLDVTDQKTSDGTPLQQWDCNHEAQQQFQFSSFSLVSPSYKYYLGAVQSGKCINVSSDENGLNPVLQNMCRGPMGTVSVAFAAPDSAGTKTFQIKFNNGEKCLDMDAGFISKNGLKAQQWDCHAGDNQRWYLRETIAAPTAFEYGKAYSLVNTNSHKCLDVTGRSLNDGTQLQQWGCFGEAQQSFVFLKGNWDDYILTQTVQSQMYLSVNLSAGIPDGAPVIQRIAPKFFEEFVRPDFRPITGPTRQHLEQVATGVYRLRFDDNGSTANSNMCLTVKGGSKSDGAMAIQKTCVNSPDQLWNLVPR